MQTRSTESSPERTTDVRQRGTASQRVATESSLVRWSRLPGRASIQRRCASGLGARGSPDGDRRPARPGAAARGDGRLEPIHPPTRLRRVTEADVSSTGQRYRFGPLERRGLIGSLRVAAGDRDRARPDRRRDPDAHALGGAGIVSALALALAAVVFCFWPIAGRSAEEWLPIVTRHAGAELADGTTFVSAAPQAGVQPGTDGRPEPVVGLPDAGSRPRTARRSVPGRDRSASSRTAEHAPTRRHSRSG